MASQPSACRWAWNTATDSTIKPSTSSSILFSFHVLKHRRFTSFSSLRNSPPSKFRLKISNSKPVKMPNNLKSDVVSISSNQIQSQKYHTLNFKKKFKSILLLNIITIVYASNIPVVKEVEAVIDPAGFNVVRFAVSALPFIPFVFKSRDDVDTRNAGIELGFWVSFGYLMQSIGLLTSDAGRASFISMFTVIVVPLLDGMLGAVVPATTWFGAFLSILGVGMLESSGCPPCVGDVLNFLSAVFFGIHMLRTEHISRSTNRKNFLPLLGYEVCVIALFSTIWYFVGGWFGGVHDCDPSTWTLAMCWDWMVAFPWIPALYTGIFSTGICLWIEMAAMRDVSATETAIIYGLEPVWGAGFAWFLLGERWGATGWIGAALVLGGSLTVQIIGSSSPDNSSVDDKRSKKIDHQLVSDKQNAFSTSPVIVSSRKDVPNILKK